MNHKGKSVSSAKGKPVITANLEETLLETIITEHEKDDNRPFKLDTRTGNWA